MTPRELADALGEFTRATGNDVYVSFNDRKDRPAIHVSMYHGSLYKANGQAFAFDVESLEDVIPMLRTECAKYIESRKLETVKILALEIIRVTDLKGNCSAADLRLLPKITANDVDLYGQEACAMADEMAGKGPFSLQETGKSNAP